MSLFNFLQLDNSEYENYAKGILYVIYELLWKVVTAIGSLVDAITGLFYKLAGLDYLGSGSESLVEEKDLLSQLFNQNIVSDLSFFMIIASVALMAIFGGTTVIKRLFFSKGEVKPTADIIQNMIMGGVFLIFLTPLTLLAISTISTITTGLANAFGSDMNVSLADVMFSSSFSGDAMEAYNAIYSEGVSEWKDVTSWTQMKNSDFLFELTYGDKANVEFYWYVYLLGGGVVLYNVVILAIRLVKRIFNVIILYLVGPVYVAKIVDDGGAKFKEWKNKAIGELVSIVGTVVGFMILLSLVSVINELELISISGVNQPTGGDLGIMGVSNEVSDVNTSIPLINNLAKMVLLMAGTSVAKDSGELLANVFTTANEEGNNLLEGIYEKLRTKEVKSSTTTTNASPRTRVITKNTTSTRKIINFSEDIPSSNNISKPQVNVVNNQKSTFNTTVNNVDRRTNNLQNRTNVSISERASGDVSKSASYRTISNDSINKKMDPTEILNRTFANYKQENDSLRKEWAFIKDGNASSSREVVKDFENASKELNNSLSLGEQNRIKDSMSKYVTAYRKEEKVAKEGYKEFAGKSAKLSNELTMKQQEELKKISTEYRKAQVDYSKTARKLKEVSVGNMSASEALRVKERADKQREKLMEASSKANNFYNNQKKGE